MEVVVEEAGEAVAHQVDHVDDGIEGGDLLGDSGEGFDGVEDAAEEDKRLEDEVGDEGGFVEVGGPDADDDAEEAEEGGDEN